MKAHGSRSRPAGGAATTRSSRLRAASPPPAFACLIHDRRNCGLSDIVIEGEQSEYEIWADDLYELLKRQNAAPAYIGGSSSGCRLSVLFALRHPQAVRGLLLWRVTGGRFACERLANNYYTQYIEAAKQGGMKAVCALEHFKERCEANPSNRATLMAMDPERFIAVMSRWREAFDRSADLPIIGASEADLKSLKFPTLVIPGNDRTHGTETGRNAARLIPGAELRIIWEKDLDIDLSPIEDWAAKDDEIAGLFIDFLKRTEARAKS